MQYFAVLLILVFSVPVFAQHDPGRNAVRLMASGETEAARELVLLPPKKMNSPITDAERHFVMAMIACREHKPEIAFQYAKEAVALGIPCQRFLAGPRDVFAPLYAMDAFRVWAESQSTTLIHGPLLGSITDVSASFWVRTAKASDVEILARPVPDKASGQKGNGRTSEETDFTTKIMVAGLSPATQYEYTVVVNSRPTGSPYRFRTMPKQGKPALVRVVFGGGAGYTPQHEYMWTTIEECHPDALLLLGDNVYIDDPTHPMTQRYCYYRRQSQPQWRNLVASTDIYTIYDDHDFGTNDCVPGPKVDQPEWKRKVLHLFEQNWNNPICVGSEDHPGCWYDFYIGDVHFIMLDGRYYRDLDGGSMLGSYQKAWLLETLKSSTGKFKILVSPVPWSKGVKPGSKDTWDGFPEEREEIFTFIEKDRIDGVILMAADRHRSDLRRTVRPDGYDLYEVMSSRLTNVHTHDLVRGAKGSEFIMGYNEKCSFGLLEFDTTREDPQVRYTIVNIDGKKIGSRILKLSQLSFGIRNHNEK